MDEFSVQQTDDQAARVIPCRPRDCISVGMMTGECVYDGIEICFERP